MAKRKQELDPRDPGRLERIRKMRTAARDKRGAKRVNYRRAPKDGEPLFSEVKERQIRFFGQQQERNLASEMMMVS